MGYKAVKITMGKIMGDISVSPLWKVRLSRITELFGGVSLGLINESLFLVIPHNFLIRMYVHISFKNSNQMLKKNFYQSIQTILFPLVISESNYFIYYLEIADVVIKVNSGY